MQNSSSGLSITGLVIGIMNILCCGFLVWPIGLPVSIIAVMRCNRGTQSGKGMAITGLILNIISMIIGTFYWSLSGFSMVMALLSEM